MKTETDGNQMTTQSSGDHRGSAAQNLPSLDQDRQPLSVEQRIDKWIARVRRTTYGDMGLRLQMEEAIELFASVRAAVSTEGGHEKDHGGTSLTEGDAVSVLVHTDQLTHDDLTPKPVREFYEESPECVHCGRAMYLREGCEWNDDHSLNLCDE